MRGKNKKSYPPRKKNSRKRNSNNEASNRNQRIPTTRKSGGDNKKSDSRENRNTGETSQRASRRSARPSQRGRFRGRSGGGFKKSDLDPSTLVNKTIKVKEGEKEIKTRAFAKLDIHSLLQEKIKRKGYEFTTEIQDKTFELLSSGDSVIGIANTGTGKTGAFLIPIINV